MSETCGNCHFGRMIPEEKDIKQRLANRRCFGNPPQVILIPQMTMGPNGKQMASMSLNNCRPIVPATDPACSHWKPQNVIDNGAIISLNEAEERRRIREGE